MTKEQLISLNKYLTDLTYKLEAPVPPKHSTHPTTYHQFLRREIEAVRTKIESAKEQGVK